MSNLSHPVYAIGVMSGTSVDGVDAVLLEISNHCSIRLIATHSEPFPEHLREGILALTQPGNNEIDRAGELHKELGFVYAQTSKELISRPGLPGIEDISVIGCHGQTVRHRPDNKHPFTLQLGCGATIAQQTGISAVTDFRSADMAVGGQGAPFAPFFHHFVFSKENTVRAIVNLGGIANVTILDGNNKDTVVGFDSGPANGLMDTWIQKHLNVAFDEDGKWATSGTLNQKLLDCMMNEPYLMRSAPKSTGRELFNEAWIEKMCQQYNKDISPEDVQSTLGRFTAESIAIQIPKCVEEIFVCGGGANNLWLMRQLSESCDPPVKTTEALGIAPQWVEAAAFAWFAIQTIERKRSSIPSVTGARKSVITGALHFA